MLADGAAYQGLGASEYESRPQPEKKVADIRPCAHQASAVCSHSHLTMPSYKVIKVRKSVARPYTPPQELFAD